MSGVKRFIIYRNNINIVANENHIDIWDMKKYPHYKLWLNVLRYFKSREFVINKNDYIYRNFQCLSQYHKVGLKKSLKCSFEITNRGITLKLSNKKNYPEDSCGNVWDDPTDKRHIALTYIERLQEKVEIQKFKKYLISLGFAFKEDEDNLSPEDYILNNLKINNHIHGEVNSLDDIRKNITEDSYDYLCNSDDKNGKKIISGTKKYFYDWRTKRLFCGKVYHNINNMWWVIYGDQLHNIACFDLFDFTNDLPKRKLPKKKRY
jgi:hypothetical protein